MKIGQVCQHAKLARVLLWNKIASIDHRNYFQTSTVHVTWNISNVNSIPTHYGVVYKCLLTCQRSHDQRVHLLACQRSCDQSVHSIARGHVIRVWVCRDYFLSFIVFHTAEFLGQVGIIFSFLPITDFLNIKKEAVRQTIIAIFLLMLLLKMNRKIFTVF